MAEFFCLSEGSTKLTSPKQLLPLLESMLSSLAEFAD